MSRVRPAIATWLIVALIQVVGCRGRLIPKDSGEHKAASTATVQNQVLSSSTPTSSSVDQEFNKYSGPLAEVSMLPPKSFESSSWSSSVLAEGAWVMDEGGGLAWPVNAGSIFCFRPEMRCVDTTAFVFNGLLSSDTTTREVERWDEHEILTKPNDAPCMRSTVRINRDLKSVTEIQTVLKTTGPCEGFKLGEFHVHLEDGIEVAKNLRVQKHNAALK